MREFEDPLMIVLAIIIVSDENMVYGEVGTDHGAGHFPTDKSDSLTRGVEQSMLR